MKENSKMQNIRAKFYNWFSAISLQRNKAGYPHVLLAVKHFSKWPSATISSHTGAESVFKVSGKHSIVYAVPKTIRTDEDTAFEGKESKEFFQNFERFER